MTFFSSVVIGMAGLRCQVKPANPISHRGMSGEARVNTEEACASPGRRMNAGVNALCAQNG
jgi:hypothetical protein